MKNAPPNMSPEISPTSKSADEPPKGSEAVDARRFYVEGEGGKRVEVDEATFRSALKNESERRSAELASVITGNPVIGSWLLSLGQKLTEEAFETDEQGDRFAAFVSAWDVEVSCDVELGLAIRLELDEKELVKRFEDLEQPSQAEFHELHSATAKLLHLVTQIVADAWERKVVPGCRDAQGLPDQYLLFQRITFAMGWTHALVETVRAELELRELLELTGGDTRKHRFEDLQRETREALNVLQGSPTPTLLRHTWNGWSVHHVIEDGEHAVICRSKLGARADRVEQYELAAGEDGRVVVISMGRTRLLAMDASIQQAKDDADSYAMGLQFVDGEREEDERRGR